MPNWKKVIVSGSDASLNSVFANNVTASVFSGSFTGSLQGTSSWATNALTSSFPITVNVNGTTLRSVSPAAGNNNVNNSIFFGANAGTSANNANDSNFLGTNAGSSANAASGSNFFGPTAGNSATNANSSNFFGSNTGNSATNANNSNFFGNRTGQSATSASFSTLIGYQAGYNVAGGALGIKSNNIIIGTNITLENGRQDSINLGGIIFGTGSYSTTSGNPFSGSANGRVGINVVSPLYTLDVSGSGNYTNGLTVTGSVTATSFTGSLLGTASFATSASQAITASYILNAISASFASTASSADNFLVRGTLTAQTIVAQTITSSTDFVTGSTRFGSLISNTHQFTGSVSMTGSLTVAGHTVGRGEGYLVENTVIGFEALGRNTSATRNTAVGWYALSSSTNNGSNTAIGAVSQRFSTGGSGNTSVGEASLFGVTTGDFNSALGQSSLGGLTDGANNVAIGYYAGATLGDGATDNTTADNSIYIGSTAYASQSNGQNEIVIGASNVGHGSNTVTLGNSSITRTILRGAVSASGGITGSLFGTASFATSASWAPGGGGGGISFPYTGSAVITGSLVVTGALDVGIAEFNSTSSATTAGTTIVSSYATGSANSAFYNYYISSGSNARAGQIMSVWSGSTINYTEVTTTDLGNTNTASFAVTLATGNVRLSFTAPGVWTVRSIVNLL
jgi:hypothetical protein